MDEFFDATKAGKHRLASVLHHQLTNIFIALNLESIAQDRILKTQNSGHAVQLSTMSVRIHWHVPCSDY